MANSIENKEELIKTIEYIATETSMLAQKAVGKTFPIQSLTVFSHTEAEFKLLSKILVSLGKPFNYNNGPRVKLTDSILIGENQISYLRIRKPDIDRPQVGCDDFEVDYQTFKNDYLLKNPANLRLVKRPEYEMIELHDNGFDVLAYVVSGQDYLIPEDIKQHEKS